MLPKKFRLLLKKEFVKVRKEGRVFKSPLFGLVVVRQQEIGKTRFGFVVSRRIDKKAVIRNRLKRLLSEAVYPLLPKVELGYNVLFLARKTLISERLLEIKKETERMLRKANLLRNNEKNYP